MFKNFIFVVFLLNLTACLSPEMVCRKTQNRLAEAEKLKAEASGKLERAEWIPKEDVFNAMLDFKEAEESILNLEKEVQEDCEGIDTKK